MSKNELIINRFGNPPPDILSLSFWKLFTQEQVKNHKSKTLNK